MSRLPEGQSQGESSMRLTLPSTSDRPLRPRFSVGCSYAGCWSLGAATSPCRPAWSGIPIRVRTSTRPSRPRLRMRSRRSGRLGVPRRGARRPEGHGAVHRGGEPPMSTEIGRVEAIFGYPVKSMAGERVDVAQLGWQCSRSRPPPAEQDGWRVPPSGPHTDRHTGLAGPREIPRPRIPNHELDQGHCRRILRRL